jgi:hypothetical protein
MLPTDRDQTAEMVEPAGGLTSHPSPCRLHPRRRAGARGQSANSARGDVGVRAEREVTAAAIR